MTSETAINGQTSTVTTYTYDANGNLIKKKEGTKSTTYAFDVWGNMTSAAGASYTYNVQGLRVSKTVGNKTTNFTVVNGKVWSDGTYKYVWGAELITNGSVYYVYNAHGDVVQLLNSSGTVTKTYDYEAYGNELTRDAADPNPFRYCGEYYDNETGFIYLRARYYNPSTGRFISVDPAKDGLNWYAYCNNNPVSYADSLGLSAERGSCAGDGTYWTKPDTNIAYFHVESETKLAKCVKGAKWAAVGITAICVGASVLTCGVATPLMVFIAGTTVVAGTATTINGVAEIGDVITGYNFMEDGVFQGDSEAYDIYAGATEFVSIAGTVICGKWLRTNAPRIKAYNNIENYKYTDTISDGNHMLRPYNNSTITQKQVIKIGEMTKDVFTADGYVFTAPGTVNGGQEKLFRLVVDIASERVLHWGHGF